MTSSQHLHCRTSRAATFLALATGLWTAWAGAPAPALAELASPVLVQDFAPGVDSAGVEPRNLTAISGRLYFSGQDAAHGIEPWISEGTADTTRPLADLCPGDCPSNPKNFTQLGEAIVFRAENADHGGGIYRIDGDQISEVLQLEHEIDSWARLLSTVYFTTHDGRLYRTDGTRAGTRPIHDFLYSASGFPLPRIGVVQDSLGEALYFADGGQLMRLAEGGAPVAISPLGTADEFTTYSSGRFVFEGCISGDCHAYVSDGTTAGTRRLEVEANGSLTSNPNHFLVWQGRVFFNTSNASSPFYHLASTDGTPAGTRHEPAPGNGFGTFLRAATTSHLFYVNGSALYSRAADGLDKLLVNGWDSYTYIGQLGDRLFFNYGTYGASFPPAPGIFYLGVTQGDPSNTTNLTAGVVLPDGVALGGKLYFGYGDNLDAGLWRSDGTAAGTEEIALGLLRPRSSSPLSYPLGGKLVSEVRFHPESIHSYLYQIDPANLQTSSIGNQPLKVSAAGATRLLAATSIYNDAQVFGFDGNSLVELPLTGDPEPAVVTSDDHFYFFSEMIPSQQFWETDGTPAGTHSLLELVSPPGCTFLCGYFSQLAAADQNIFFYADRDNQGGVPQLSVWDRTRNEKRVLLRGIELYPFPLALPGGRAFFQQFPPTGTVGDRELWISDGTAAGTRSFFTLPAGHELRHTTVAGNRLFLVTQGPEGKETLWVSDFTTAGTLPLTAAAEVSYLELVAAGANIYFAAAGSGGRELGFSDGSAAGTRLLDLRPGPEGSQPTALAPLADGRVAFAAVADDAGYELWISGGTSDGSYRLTDLNPGPAAATPASIREAGGRLFFTATDGDSGRELWALDLPGLYPPCPEGKACVLGGRFEIEVIAHAPDGDFIGRPAVRSEESVVYAFFSENNWEMLVKVLDGCHINQKHWVLAAAATDVAFTLTVTDRANGTQKVYRNTSGQAAPAITDTAAFACN